MSNSSASSPMDRCGLLRSSLLSLLPSALGLLFRHQFLLGEFPYHRLGQLIPEFNLPWHLDLGSVSYTHLRAHETDSYLVCRLLLEKKKNKKYYVAYFI